MMKNKWKPSIHHFGPRAKISPKLKMTHGARVRKMKKRGSKFVSSRMNKIHEEIKKRSNIMRTIDVANQAFVPQQAEQNAPKDGNSVQPKTISTSEHLAPLAKNVGKSTHSPSMTNRALTSKVSANSKCSRNGVEKDATLSPISAKNASKSTHSPSMGNRPLTSKVSANSNYSPIVVEKVSTLNPISNGTLKPLELSRKAKMKEGSIHSLNSIKRSYSQASHLKAMSGLVHNTKNQSNLDGGATQAIQIESRPNAIGRMEDKDTMCESLAQSKISVDTHLNLPRKRRKYIDTNDDIDDTFGHQSDENDSTRVPLDHATLKGSSTKVTTLFVSKCVAQTHDCCSKPIDEAVWSGMLKIGSNEFIPLAGHLSTKSCKKVRNLSKSLRRMVGATKMCRSEVWPKRWEASRPTSDNIGLYFFPYNMRPDKYYDQLVMEVVENDLALQTTIDEAELLIFPSSLLPEQYQMFQSKHYLWGVFRPKVVERKHGDESQHVDKTSEQATNATSSVPIDATVAATIVEAVPTKAHTGPTNQGRIDSSMGALPGRVVSFVVRQTPRVEHLIQEMEREGALIVAMQGEMLSSDGPLHRWHGDRNAASRSSA